MKQITVLFFASLKEKAGVRSLELALHENATVADLKECLRKRIPDLARGLETALASVNHDFAFDQDTIPDQAEVGFFPPVSGGADGKTIVQIVENEFDLNQLLLTITRDTTGAACFFTGVVRGITTGDHSHETIELEYEAYQSMAEEKMMQIAGEIRQRWPDIEGIIMVQRIGILKPGTPSVVIGCSASHRNIGIFEAARYGIDRLKEIVPIWKKEVSPRGEIWVEGDYRPTRMD